jgi:hypothetical protein
MFSFKTLTDRDNKRTLTSGVIIFAVIIVLSLLNFFYPTSSRIAWGKTDSQIQIDKLVDRESTAINDSLPFYQYKRLRDSIKADISEDFFTGLYGSGQSVFNFGTREFKIHNGNTKYYLAVSGYFAKTLFDFYRLHGQNYIEYGIHSKTYDNGTEVSDPKTDTTTLILEQQNDREWQILYPISKTANMVITLIIYTLMFIGFAILYYGILVQPLKILFLIAKGEAFSEEAIARFYNLFYVLLYAGVVISVLRIAFHLYFRTHLPYPLTFYYYDDVMSGSTSFIAALVVLLIAKAFQSGHRLQLEQDLTV